MEVKKNPNVSVGKLKGTFILTGLIFVLGLLLVAFNWNSSAGTMVDLGVMMDVSMEEQMIQTHQEDKITPPPPPKPKIIEQLTVVDNTQKIDIEATITSEATEKTMITQTSIKIDAPKEDVEPEVYIYAEEMPEFPGGEAALFKYINENIKYPKIAKENGIQGIVFVQFVIGKTGEIVNVYILRGVDPSLNQEAIRVVSSMPKWSPGKQRGVPVHVSFQMPINFRLK